MIWPVLFRVKVFVLLRWPYHILHTTWSETTFQLSKVYIVILDESVVHLWLFAGKFDIHPLGVYTILLLAVMST